MNIVGQKQFNEALLSDKLVLVDFRAERCGPCRMLGPLLEEIASSPEYKDKILLCKVNIDDQENYSLAEQYAVTSIPQVSFFHH